MPLGDSITGSPGCWRALLWTDLQNAGFTNIDFVGTLPPQGCGIAHDGDNEGHGGILATNMADQNQLVPWLAATRPDIVVMHLGTNDVWNARTPSVILTAFSKLVDQMRAQNPNMKILVAQIIPMNPSNCTECASRVVALNAAIPAWAQGKTTAQSPITVVDQWTGFDTATDTFDGVHPIDPGNRKIANRWFPALTAALNGTLTPNFSLSVNPAAVSLTVGTTQPATVAVSRSGGFTGAVALAASGLPPGVTVSFNPASAMGTSTITFTASSAAALGRVDVTITGTGGGLTRTTRVGVTVTTAGGGPGPATATPLVAASGPWFNEEQVRIATSVPLTAVTLTITLQTTGGITFNGQYNTVGSFTQMHSSTATAITYQWTGQLSPGTNWIFAAQSGGSGTAHPTSGDTYTLTYTAGGTNFTTSGHF
ncbi:MAG TPA: SGNH/GDSL hydrolase family protein [Kofleriaceae bacterium]|nr:SGNH/GDSL hydrolase family protein [Kofleriaceae bacterium]